MVEEWQPEPLAPTLTEEEQWMATPDVVLTGYARSVRVLCGLMSCSQSGYCTQRSGGCWRSHQFLRYGLPGSGWQP